MTYDSLRRCRDYILADLSDEMSCRSLHKDWIERERSAVAIAANQWAKANKSPTRVTIEDVEAIERMAVGHIDYASKLSLYVAEMIVYPLDRAGTKE